MNNKRNTYILLAAVLLIWGLIGYRVVKTLRPAPGPSGTAASVVAFTPVPVKEQAPFEISRHDRDPFLGTISRPRKRIAKPVAKSKTPEIPEIQAYYSGMVQEDTSGEQIYFVQIDEVQHLMRIGDEIGGVRLLGGNAGQITILAHGKRREIPRQ